MPGWQYCQKAGARKNYDAENAAVTEAHLNNKRVAVHAMERINAQLPVAIGLMRTRKLLQRLSNDPGGFRISGFGYYDYSHFYKEVRKFMSTDDPSLASFYLQLVKRLPH